MVCTGTLTCLWQCIVSAAYGDAWSTLMAAETHCVHFHLLNHKDAAHAGWHIPTTWEARAFPPTQPAHPRWWLHTWRMKAF